MNDCPLSIILPVLNEAENLQQLLPGLQTLREAGAELLLVDAGSDDGSAIIADGLVDICLQSERGRAAQMNRGAAVAKGRWLLFLHADTVLPADIDVWLEMLNSSDSDWGFFSLQLSGRQRGLRWVEWGINQRSRLTRVATGDQALFVRRHTFAALGGFPAIALMEDVALCKLLKSQSRPLIWRTPVQTSSRRWEANGVLRTVLLMWWLRLLYVCGVSPADLARRYYG